MDLGSVGSSMVRGGQDFKLDIELDIREYFRESKVFIWTQEEIVSISMIQELSRGVSVEV